jgi:hypothetical protein
MKTAAEIYNSSPDGTGGVRLTLRRPIQTRDARTCGPSLPLFRSGDAIRLATARERGHTRDDAPVRVGVGQSLITPPPRISLGRVWNGINDVARAAGVDPEDLDLSEEQAHGLMAAVVDALKRKARDQERAPPAGRPPKTTEDARPVVPSSIHAASLRQTRDYALGLAPKRAALSAQSAAAPAPTARMTAKDFAALRAKKGAAA